MKQTIRVHIGDEARLVGTLHYDQQGARESAAFEYDAAWLADAERFAIEPALALVAGPQFHRKTRDGSVDKRAYPRPFNILPSRLRSSVTPYSS